MADVKWVKLTTDMFDNRKIKHLRRLPEGNNIVLIWVMLLTMAGRCNAGGMIFLTENIPYTPKMLADELDFEETTVGLALQVLEQLDMIVMDNGFFSIAGWEEYQNIEGMEKIREQNRLAQRRAREKKKLLASVNDKSYDSHMTVTLRHDIEEDIEEEKELEKEYIESSVPPHAPTLDEVKKYCDERGNNIDADKFYDYYTSIGWMSRGNIPIRDWKTKVRYWEKTEHKKTESSFDTNEFFQAALNKSYG